MEGQILNRSSGYHEPIEPFVQDFIQRFVERIQVFGRGMGGFVACHPDKPNIRLERSISDQSKQLSFGYHFSRHEVEHGYA
jgi:hypothetical protein